MGFKTFGDLNKELENELDLEGEEFIDKDELKRLWNRAVSVCEGHIATLGLKDKYLLARQYISLVQGQEEYNLPSNMFENKFFKIIYCVGATLFELRPMDSKHMFEEYRYLNNYTSSDYYRYMITHNTPGVQKLVIVPKPTKSETNALEIWYPRSANRYVADTDICDLPPFSYEFLNAYVTEKVYKKESHVNYEAAVADRREKEQLMIAVLSGQTQDNARTEIDADLSAYEEST